ncbi:hypothetical protein GCM10007415_20680 [Parapedobacter pyrenivorans]|uniref:Cytochrome c domain-containing protein n=1 Tax=Parapedobacter pyrenivorans TaxID=1305674 RepID=A0A917HRB0_9SPHI|nr:pyrroloquinoline quinone-dependent dehydrogenase [Parapedobacter pyrenivorans]GGG86897.1 hypothetical protein GCM10007415_20680 [Parapedobacter pyrenivorans]
MKRLVWCLLLCGCTVAETQYHDWPSYLGGADRNHYSKLSQLDTSNVALLQTAWEYHTGDSGQVQCNPIIIEGKLYGVTASNHLFALDAVTGRELWRFDPDSTRSSQVNRGVAYWQRKDDRRILYAYQSWLYAVDATTGKPIRAFGSNGRVSLREGLGEAAGDKFVVSTTPGTIFEDLIVMPTRVGEGPGAAPGYIQAFNVVSGKLAWVFHTIPHPGEPGFETWPADAYKNPAIGGANNWAGMAVDHGRGIVYVPTGSPAFDFYGGNRKGENLFANSLLALDAKTGTYLWHYQAVRHDVWDRDFPAPPNLVRIRRDGRVIDAVAQVTKSGHVFIFDRETGESLFPIDEISVPSTILPGEDTWPTQPVPRLPKPFARQTISEEDITHFSANRDSLLAIYRRANKGAFHPLDFNETLLFPGADGGAEWGGAAVDPSGVMYINSNEMPWLFSLNRKEGLQHNGSVTLGKQLYITYCMACHKPDLSGNPGSGYPSLIRLKDKMHRKDVMAIIATGKGMMPGFTNITASQKQALVSYLFGEEKEEVFSTAPTEFRRDEMPYVFNGYNKFLDENGYPAIVPPWGTLTAIDLATGLHRWQIPLGEFQELTGKGLPPTGTENYGGPLVTAGGLLFIAATKDGMFRAFHKETGKLLWQVELPASGFATPATYSVAGKQYIVIACGGTKLGTRKGDSYLAFALPGVS